MIPNFAGMKRLLDRKPSSVSYYPEPNDQIDIYRNNLKQFFQQPSNATAYNLALATQSLGATLQYRLELLESWKEINQQQPKPIRENILINIFSKSITSQENFALLVNNKYPGVDSSNFLNDNRCGE